MRSAFSLVELMIVVSILGILAAIVLPELQAHSQQAKEAAVKDTLRVVREAIERYAIDHNGVPPGYENNNQELSMSGIRFYIQMAQKKTYLTKMPVNPFNNEWNVYIVQSNNKESLPSSNVGNYGWIYQPSTKTFKINWFEVDSTGQIFFDY